MTINEASAQTPAAAPPTVPAFASNHQIKPRKFDPAKLEGLAERWAGTQPGDNCVRSSGPALVRMKG